MPRRPPPAASAGLAALAGALLYAGWTWRAGQDASWDLQNYHDYAAYALLHWRYPLDVGMGGFQGYLNPLPYLVPYGLRHALPPLAAGLALAVLQSGAVAMAWMLSGALLPPGSSRPLVLRGLATAVGATGATALSEAGTSFADLQLAALVLGGAVLLLRADGPGPDDARRAARRLALAGVLVGAATGLKLTNAVFAVGLMAGAAVPWQRPPGAVRAAGLIGAGLAAGFLMTGGAWAAYMWASLGNPLFPAMNWVFQSPSAALSNYADLRFLPGSVLGGLAYPAQIAFGLHPTAEVPFAEPRLLLALLATLALAFGAVVSGAPMSGAVVKAWRAGTVPVQGDRRMVRAAAFLAASMAAWIGAFAIQRYAVALEMLSGVVLVMAAPRLFPGRMAPVAALALAAVAVGGTRSPDWWRRPWSNAFTAVPPPALLAPAAYAVVSHPIGYWASALPEASRFYTVYASMGLATGGVLRERLSGGLENPPNGLVWTLGHDFPMDEAAREGLAAQGLVPTAPCHRARSLWWVDTIACRAKRVGWRPRAAADLRVGEAADFSRHGAGWIYLADGWRNAGQAGTATQGRKSELVLRPDSTERPLALDATLSAGAASAQDGNQMAVVLDGEEAVRWNLPLTGPEARSVCLPFRVEGRTSDVLSIVLRRPGVLRKPGPAASDDADIVLHGLLLRDARPGECGHALDVQ